MNKMIKTEKTVDRDAALTGLSGPGWYVVRTNHRQERLANASLAGARLETYLPMQVKSNHHGEVYGAVLFPDYLFVRLSPDSPGWTQVFTARGVAAVLGKGGRPSPLADVVIQRLRDREFDGFVKLGIAPACPFKPGQPVLLNKGPLGDIDALFVEKLDKNRCSVLIKLLGDSPRLARASLHQLRPM